ncbi:MAG: 16S rRNA (cytidine(1402)-2'-O)-methyltransferase [Burkholderiaceae bacterium]|nr:16S rRNA (cytidine(1402)-2'-O)-methyltransferase [Burkholderiaceae bacterium]
MSGSTGSVEPGSLYVVATPIGHLSDIGGRAAEVLREVDLVAAEDTRTTRVLLEHLGAHPQTMSAHRHNEHAAARRIVEALGAGRSVALVSDAGTPAVSDPGARIVDDVRRAGHRVVPVPGPSAPLALVSASGLVEGPFHFEGFLPARAKARDARLAQLARMPHPFVLFEAPHRIAQTLAAIARASGAGSRIAIGRELTKRYEEIHVCDVADATAWLDADENRLRGEYVLVVSPAAAVDDGQGAAGGAAVDVAALLSELLAEIPLSRAVRLVGRVTSVPRRTLYAMALATAHRVGANAVDEGDAGERSAGKEPAADDAEDERG